MPAGVTRKIKQKVLTQKLVNNEKEINSIGLTYSRVIFL